MAVVRVETNEGIATVTLDRPDALNAFSGELMDELCEAFLAVEADDAARVLVLTGAGRAFSAGADLKAMSSSQPTPRFGLEGLLFAIVDFSKPFIVAANGLGVGIGCTICGLADVTFMARSARFRCPFSTLGLTAEAASTYTFPRLMGHQAASWTLLSSEWLSAERCQEMGLALEVFDDDCFMESVTAEAAKLAVLPLPSLRQTKELLVGPRREEMKRAVVAENAGLAALSGGPANREALRAFAEKRDPDFSSL